MRPVTMTSLRRLLGRTIVASAFLACCGLSLAADMNKPPLELVGIQSRMEAALSRANADGGGAPSVLAVIDGELTALRQADKHDYYTQYWKSYLLYRKAGEHMSSLSSLEFDKGKKPLVEAVDLLEKIEPRDVEVVALLGLVAGLHLAYVPRHRIILANSKAAGYLAEALRLDGENARALYANAVTDYHTPEEYGGKRKTERLLKRALEKLPYNAAGLAPRWGRREVATLLVRYYMDEARINDARGVLEQARLRWPSNSNLLQLKIKLDQQEARAKGPSGMTSP